MSMTCKSAGGIATVMVLLIGGSAFCIAAPTAPETYQILQQRSIFSRERARAPRTWTPPPAPKPTSAGPAEVPVFTGAVYDETECVALLEDPQSRAVTTLHVGQIVPQGRIEAITLDYIMVRPTADAEPRRIEIGHTLTGELAQALASPIAPASTAPADAGATTTATTAATPGSPPLGGGGGDLIERMRQRRMQELRGR